MAKSSTSRGLAGNIVLGAVAVLLAVLTAVKGPQVGPASPDSYTPSYDPATVTRASIDATLGRDGTLVLDEMFTVELPEGRHGIYRIFDLYNERTDTYYPLGDVTVERDGEPEESTFTVDDKDVKTLRIGRADTVLDAGVHTYHIVSTTRGVLESKAEDKSTTLWWWNIIGTGWAMPMEQVDVKVNLPAEPTSSECVYRDDSPCEATVVGRTVTTHVEQLAPGEPVTLRVGFDAREVPANTSANTPAKEDKPEASWLRWATLAALGGLVGAVAGFFVRRAGKEREPGFPVLFEPPAGMRPATAAFLVDETPSKAALQATLFDLADRGVVTIGWDGPNWQVRCGTTGWDTLEGWEREMLGELGISYAGSWFTVDKSVEAGQRIARANEALTRGAALANRGMLRSDVLATLGRIGGWLSLVVLGYAAFHGVFSGGGPGDPTLPAALAGALAGFVMAAGTVMVVKGATTRRTEEARDAWSRAGGFRRFLCTESSDARFDAAAKLDWYPRYLPWAVAFGVGEEWTARYQAQGVEPQAWYLPGVGYHDGRHTSSFAAFSSSFDESIRSATSAYSASQRSSGGGGFSGGGFSGGSGGGGGGGGSW